MAAFEKVDLMALAKVPIAVIAARATKHEQQRVLGQVLPFFFFPYPHHESSSFLFPLERFSKWHPKQLPLVCCLTLHLYRHSVLTSASLRVTFVSLLLGSLFSTSLRVPHFGVNVC